MVSVAVAVAKLRVVAAVSLDNMAAIELPLQIDRVVILQQHDKPGSPAARKLDTIIHHIEQQGVDVLLMPPPNWAGVKDINDAMRALHVA